MISRQKPSPNRTPAGSPSETSPAQSPRQYSEIQPIFKLRNSRFPVYFAYSQKYKQKLVMKVFQHVDGEISPNFHSEARVAEFSHSSLIKILDTKTNVTTFNRKTCEPFSYVLMELAPYGNFCDLILLNKIPRYDQIARTFFRQLIEGVEFLHDKDVAHMDLKLENLLLGNDFKLKIIDFDACRFSQDEELLGRGTKNYRAPEVITEECSSYMKADIYSAGIILFALKTGCLPYYEEDPVNGVNLYEVLLKDRQAFWKAYESCQKRKVDLDDDFKDLFESMVDPEPEKRATIEEIKSSNWYNKAIFSDKEMQLVMSIKLKSTQNGQTAQGLPQNNGNTGGTAVVPRGLNTQQQQQQQQQQSQQQLTAAAYANAMGNHHQLLSGNQQQQYPYNHPYHQNHQGSSNVGNPSPHSDFSTMRKQ